MISQQRSAKECVFCVLKPVLKDEDSEKMYIVAMKKAIAVILILAAFAALLSAQGTPEEQRLIFETLMNNSQTQTQTRTNSSGLTISSRASSQSNGAEIISR
ncbi:MAG: hypothetical protein IJM73_00055, partial [Spirochaetales bacterium]|nr:hypothetical protein [Spirochaetales bacterium]